MIKRILSFIICAWIGFFSVFASYQDTVEAADWVENLTNGASITATVSSILASAGASPLLIAMLLGGSALVTSGVFVDYITSTPIDQLKTDIREMGDDIRGLYETWLERGERQRIQAENALLSAEEVASEAITSAKNKAQKFWDNAVNVKGETKEITKEEYKEWAEFNRELSEIGVNTPIVDIGGNAKVFGQELYSNFARFHVGKPGNEFQVINGKTYIKGGTFGIDDRDIKRINFRFSVGEDNAYCVIVNCDAQGLVSSYIVEFQYIQNKWIQTVTESLTSFRASNTEAVLDFLDNICDITNLPVVLFKNWNSVFGNYEESLSVIPEHINIESGSIDPGQHGQDESLQEMLKRIAQMNLLKALIENYQRVKEEQQQSGVAARDRSPVKEGNVPVKASSVKSSTTTNDQTGEDEKRYTGSVGWNIPDDRTTAQTIVNYYIYDHEGVYDDSLPYDYPYDDAGVADPSYPDDRARGATGVLSIPDVNVHPKAGENDNDIDRDAPVEGTREETADPDDPDDPVDPEKPFSEIADNMPYIPQNMDLTQLFPFCIPFDIIYLFEKFQSDRAEAPVLELVIPMPANVGMGDGYHFTIDFKRFVVLRDIIYIFLLLGFILGLMKLTRGIIRG